MTLFAHKGRCPRCGNNPDDYAPAKPAPTAQPAPVAPQWQPTETRPAGRGTYYLIANAVTGHVAAHIDGVIHNQPGTAADWQYGEAITHWMPLPAAPGTPPAEPAPQPDVPLSFRPTPRDWLLWSKVADLLHLLEFSAISTATGGDDVQAQKVMAELRAMLAATPQPAPRVAQPLTDARLLEMAAEAETPAWGEWFSDEDALLKFARAVEAATAHPKAPPITAEQIWASDEIMAINARCGLQMHDLLLLVHAVQGILCAKGRADA